MDSPLDSQNTTSHVRSWRERQEEQNLKNNPEAAAAKKVDDLEKELRTVANDLKTFRVTGVGFSGQGPRGIMFTPNSNQITVRICVNGSAQDKFILIP